MTTTLTPNRAYSNQGTGDNTGAWGPILNANFTEIDLNLSGGLTQALTNTNVTFTTSQAQNLYYTLTGTLTASVSLIFPAIGGFYIINNQTTGSFAVAIACAGGGSTVIAPQNYRCLVYCDGTNIMLADDARQTIEEPKGRLTLTSGTPVLTSTVSSSGSLFYTPDRGGQVPIFSGTGFTMTAFSELTCTLSDATKSPAAAVANSVYDMFLWSDAGTLRLSRGPAWPSLTARGTGAGSSQLVSVSGIPLNAYAITNGPNAGNGTYVGTIATDPSTATCSMNFGGTGGGGGSAYLGVWNAYQRRRFVAVVQDSNASHTYSGAAIRAFGGGAWRISAVSGLAEEGIETSFQTVIQTTGAGVGANIGIGVDSTTAYFDTSCTVLGIGGAVYSAATARDFFRGVGLHYVQACEASDGTNANTFYTGGLASLRAAVFA